MKTLAKQARNAFLGAMIAGSAHAQSVGDGCDDLVYQDHNQAAAQAAEKHYAAFAPIVRRPANLLQLSCFDRFINPKGVDILFDVNRLLSGLTRELLSQVCAAADQIWSQVPPLDASVYLRRNVDLPYGVSVDSARQAPADVRIYYPGGQSGTSNDQSLIDRLFGR